MTFKRAQKSTDNHLFDRRDGEKPKDAHIYDEVFDAILSRRLRPGTKLPEDELVDIFGVSRTVVRRALLRLSHDRIVDLKLNRGATVSAPGIKEAKEILDARRMIEIKIARVVAGQITDAELATTRELVMAERDCFHAEQTGSGIRLSGNFHLELAKLSGNSTLMNFIQELVPRTSLVIAQYEIPNHAFCSHQEHFELLDVMATHDVDAAAQMMDTHLQHIEDKLDLSEAHSPDLREVFSS